MKNWDYDDNPTLEIFLDRESSQEINFSDKQEVNAALEIFDNAILNESKIIDISTQAIQEHISSK